ncbi:hypothetical protein BJP36_39650 [Moorena producens JHB]|uniref:Uncharacterized protein n=1 Tax=Moorena producens (strain JHB) TaxID=1454205 RepID=A0A9Q9SV10_MOOP1|nr:hypothetical protein [Moorena producens]WAN70169.1 hypothetical protein BJP36_39650 [Moorena producens JHB]
MRSLIPQLNPKTKSVSETLSKYFPFPPTPPIPDSRFPIPVPLLGGVRGGFRFPTPDSPLPKGICYKTFQNML